METLNKNRLAYLIQIIPDLLSNIPEETFLKKEDQNKWSKKEILGHLIDSATNNHQRFVRAQFEETPIIPYNQDMWNKHSFYNLIDTRQIISFWKFYNIQILELFNKIPKDLLIKECNTGGKNNFTIAFLFNDYIEHLEHHLNQIVSYE
jgi:hypothetical protein